MMLDAIQSSPVDYHTRITTQPGKRSGQPCIRGLLITVGNVLGWLASGMTEDGFLILNDFSET